MGLISRANDYVWSYIAPRKTQQKRDKPFKPLPNDKRTPIHAASRLRELRERQARSSSEPSETPISPDEAELQLRQDDNSTGVDPEGDTPHLSVERTPARARASNHLNTPSTSNPIRTASPDDFDANESTLVMTEHDYANERLEHKETFDVEAERKRLQNTQMELEEQGWASDAILLFIKLEARGKEPLLPKSWELLFETLPAALFTPESSTAHISSMLGEAGDFRASRALKELISLAPRVRDADFASKGSTGKKPKSPEMVIKKAIAEYLKWAYADAKLNVASPNSRKSLDSALAVGKSLPLLINEAGPRTVSGAELQASALNKLVKLGEHWKAALTDAETGELITELPTLYAVISTFTVFGFVAYDIDFVNDDGELEEPFLRTIALFDFSQKGYDVWNSLAIALLGVHVRNEMVDIKKDIQAFRGEEHGVGTDDDVDA